jgi:hypothetical protein
VDSSGTAPALQGTRATANVRDPVVPLLTFETLMCHIIPLYHAKSSSRGSARGPSFSIPLFINLPNFTKKPFPSQPPPETPSRHLLDNGRSEHSRLREARGSLLTLPSRKRCSPALSHCFGCKTAFWHSARDSLFPLHPTAIIETSSFD